MQINTMQMVSEAEPGSPNPPREARSTCDQITHVSAGSEQGLRINWPFSSQGDDVFMYLEVVVGQISSLLIRDGTPGLRALQ